MTRWEYKVAVYENGFLKWRWQDGEVKPLSLEGGLDYLGSQGWELVGMSADQVLGSTTRIRYVFKRPQG